MKGGKQRHSSDAEWGYTIIEVMIVLAVSAVMFLIASQFISGKQGRTAFGQGVNELASTLQDTVEGVIDGQYTDIAVNCQFNGVTTTVTTVGAHTQGSNSQCVFLGKVLHFSEDVSGQIAAERYEVFSLAGGRVGTDNKPITSLSAAAPVAINPALTSHSAVPQHLAVDSIKVNGGAIDSYGIGFIQGLGTPEVTGDVQTGTQSVGLYYVAGLGPNTVNTTAAGLINGTNLLPANRIEICLTDGNLWALITLGNNNNQLGVTVDNRGGSSC